VLTSPPRAQEQAQLAAIRDEMKKTEEAAAATSAASAEPAHGARDRDFEGGFGGQEDLEDRYATTSGEH
jgi:hypothetical protein